MQDLTPTGSLYEEPAFAAPAQPGGTSWTDEDGLRGLGPEELIWASETRVRHLAWGMVIGEPIWQRLDEGAEAQLVGCGAKVDSLASAAGTLHYVQLSPSPCECPPDVFVCATDALRPVLAHPPIFEDMRWGGALVAETATVSDAGAAIRAEIRAPGWDASPDVIVSLFVERQPSSDDVELVERIVNAWYVLGASRAFGGWVGYPLGRIGENNGGMAAHTYKHRNDGIQRWENNRAIDLNVPFGSTVCAVFDGQISPGGLSFGLGKEGFRLYLVGKNDVAYYTHLSRLLVEQNDVVKKGQLLGLSGCGTEEVPHVHIALKTGNPDLYGKPYRAPIGGRICPLPPNKLAQIHAK